jgi:hypothetical protein
MLRAAVAVNLAACLMIVSAGCNQTTRQYEGQACSINSSDDPLLVCSPAYDLVCINTYSVVVLNPKEAARWDGGIRPIFVCRLACDPAMSGCFQPGDVCCPGDIYGKTYGKTGGCVPRSNCHTLGDAGTPDAAGDAPAAAGDGPDDVPAAPVDARGDAGAADAGSDVVAPDAAVPGDASVDAPDDDLGQG